MKILIIDDHALIREALRSVLQEAKEGAVVLEAGNSHEAMQRIEDHPDIDLITLDLNLPDRDGLDMLAELGERRPAACVVVLSAHQDRDIIARALELDAAGYIPKSAPREVMLGAFNLIFSGGVYVPPEVLASKPVPPRIPAAPAVSAAALGLTERQMEVLTLMMRGKSNKAICRALDLAEPTVKAHVTAILKAFKVTNRTEAVIAAGALGLASHQSPP